VRHEIRAGTDRSQRPARVCSEHHLPSVHEVEGMSRTAPASIRRQNCVEAEPYGRVWGQPWGQSCGQPPQNHLWIVPPAARRLEAIFRKHRPKKSQSADFAQRTPQGNDPGGNLQVRAGGLLASVAAAKQADRLLLDALRPVPLPAASNAASGSRSAPSCSARSSRPPCSSGRARSGSAGCSSSGPRDRPSLASGSRVRCSSPSARSRP
jgi:hypothetical protein